MHVCAYVYVYVPTYLHPRTRVCVCEREYTLLDSCVAGGAKNILSVYQVVCVHDAEDASSCRGLFAKEPLITGLFCGK